jgi:hypothetical protein
LLENLEVGRKLYNGVGKFRPLKMGNSTPLLTPSIIIPQGSQTLNILGSYESFKQIVDFMNLEWKNYDEKRTLFGIKKEKPVPFVVRGIHKVGGFKRYNIMGAIR